MHHQAIRVHRPAWRGLLAVALGVSAVCPNPAHAVDFFWDGELSNQWADFSVIGGFPVAYPTNWNPDRFNNVIVLPGPNDTVNFDRGSVGYTVNGIPTSNSNDRLLVHNDNLGLPVAGVYNLTNVAAAAPSVVVGVSNGDVGHLRLSGGGTMNSVYSVVGLDAGSSGQVTVSVGTTWNNSAELNVGGFGSGVLGLTGDARVTSQNAAIAAGKGSTGLVNLNSSNNQDAQSWNNTGNLTVGREGDATLLINYADMTTNNAYVASEPGSTGTVYVGEIDDPAPFTRSAYRSGQWIINNELHIGGDTTGAGGTGLVKIDAYSSFSPVGGSTFGDSTVSVQGMTTIWSGGRLEIGDARYWTGEQNLFFALGGLTIDGGALEVNPTAFFLFPSGAPLVARNNAQIDFDSGNTTTLNIQGGTAALLQTGADWRMTGTLDVKSSLRVESGATLGGLSGGRPTVAVSNAAANLTITGANSSVSAAGFSTIGTVLVENSGHLNATSASVSSTGNLTIAGGALQVDSTLTINGGSFTMNGGTAKTGTINHTGGGTFNFTGGTLHVETFVGDLDQDGGTLAPGSSPGTTAVTGNYVMNTGTLAVELGGLTPGAGHDQVNVTGDANISGDLDIALTNGFAPNPGDTFELLTFGGNLTGAFANVINSTGFAGLILNVTSDVDSIDLTLAALAGDLNLDGFVGIDDLNIVLGAWNQNVTAGAWGLGDPSGDGFIGIDDLNTVLGNWNAGTPPPPINTQTNIPEPGSAAMIFAGVGLLSRTRRRG